MPRKPNANPSPLVLAGALALLILAGWFASPAIGQASTSNSPSASSQNGQSDATAASALPRGKKLALKDGRILLVREYKVEGDRIKAEQAVQKMHADVVQLGTPDLADNLESDLSHGQVADRDADGRLPWTLGEGPAGDSENDERPEPPEPAAGSPKDELDGRGQQLDLNA